MSNTQNVYSMYSIHSFEISRHFIFNDNYCTIKVQAVSIKHKQSKIKCFCLPPGKYTLAVI